MSEPWPLQSLSIYPRAYDDEPDAIPTLRAVFYGENASATISLPLTGRLVELCNELESLVRDAAREGLRL